MAETVLWTGPFTVNAGNTAGTQILAAPVGLADGSFMIAWVDDTDNVDGDPGTDIIAQRFDPVSGTISAPFQLNDFGTLAQETDPDIVALPNGGFVVAYEQNTNLGDTDILYEEYDADFNIVDQDVAALGAAGADQVRNPTIAAFATGDYTIVFERTSVGDTDIRAVTPTAGTPEFDAGQNGADFDRRPDSAAFLGGNFVTVYEEQDGGLTSIEFHIRNASTVFQTQGQVVNDGEDPHVAVLNSTNFVVTWTTPGGGILGEIRAADGTIVRDDFTIANAVGDNESASAVVALRDGGFFVVWYDGNDDRIEGRRFDADGNGVGIQIVIDDGPTLMRPELALLDDGRVLVTWDEGGDIRAAIVDPRDEMISGSVFDDVITSRPDASTVNGFGGNDTIYGGPGDDVLLGDTGDDTILPRSAITGANHYSGGSGIDLIDWTGSLVSGGDFNLASETASTIANPGVQETMTVFERLRGTQFGDRITGSAGGNDLYGAGGDDVIDGGAGADLMYGGTGDDTFIVGQSNDQVFEYFGEGANDRVRAAVDYELAPGRYIEVLTTILGSATDAIDLTGNAFTQEIVGNYGDNVLTDGPIFGAADHLRGLSGNDVYRVFNSGTTIAESAAQGAADRVMAAVDYQLGAGVHVELLTTILGSATDDIHLTGNQLAQEIIGNYGDNVLHDGGAGAGDHLRGLSGNDTYRVFNADTTIVESAAQGADDRVITAVDYTLGAGVHVETLQTNGGMGTADRDLTGNEIGQEIIGNNGDNRLEGKGGDDTLRGLGGDDSFVFADPLGTGNVDTIVDFDPADDRFLLSNNIFSGFGDRTGAILPGHLRVNTSGQAQDASDMIIYESDAGRVWYDADGFGAGARVLFAVIDPGLAVTNADFVLA